MSNGYFQLINVDRGVALKVVKAENGGESVTMSDILKYLERKKIVNFDTVSLNKYVVSQNYEQPFPLASGQFFPESEEAVVTISDDSELAFIRFYPASSNGSHLSKGNIMSALSNAGVSYGIKEDIINSHLAHPLYCTDMIIAKAVQPIQGRDAKIDYFFDTKNEAKPKLNEDGSVDFHQLNNIQTVSKGDLLARLTPANLGQAGIDVRGVIIKQKQVKVRVLKQSRNVTISENKKELFANVSGHVTLVDDTVFVSDLYEVPVDVDSSTGDIVYNGNVQINGNVLTGFSVKADGDVIVNGVVEGATIIAGGQIVLKRGIQGMSRGVLEAKGNIVANFIENSTVTSGGYIMTDAILHSQVNAKEDITVSGKRGLVTGGAVVAGGSITVKEAGSTMGTHTALEVGCDPEVNRKHHKNEIDIKNQSVELRQMEQVIFVLGKKLEQGEKLPMDKIKFLKTASLNREKLIQSLEKMREEQILLEELMEVSRDSRIRIEKIIYAGTKIEISKTMLVLKKTVTQCQFIKDGADIKALKIR